MKRSNYETMAAIVSDIQAKNKMAGMIIQDYKMINKSLVSVVATVGNIDNEDAINNELLDQTEQAASLVSGSIRKVENDRYPVVRFFAMANTRTCEATPEFMNRLVQVNANIYADEETNSIWRLDGEGDDQFLVQQSSDNLEEIFEARKNRMRLSSTQTAGTVPFCAGDFAAYCSASGRIRTGLLYETDDGLHVANFESRSREDISPYQVICAADISHEEKELDVNELSANISTKQGTNILNYFRKLYGDRPEFFNRLTTLVRNYDGKVQVTDTNPQVNEMLHNRVSQG